MTRDIFLHNFEDLEDFVILAQASVQSRNHNINKTLSAVLQHIYRLNEIYIIPKKRLRKILIFCKQF